VGTSEETNEMFNHFAEHHPETLQQAVKKLGFKLKKQ